MCKKLAHVSFTFTLGAGIFLLFRKEFTLASTLALRLRSAGAALSLSVMTGSLSGASSFT
ncbi:uncharacterized protein PHACADRAFT_266381 [Phanerochaete carnosa HHB-10118-sp]|uniref:Uncharacterized protein n=1 Tax=Phanerochaete carnosa (strain HHB-10118-sp) TaxID=650164 RepID=K5VBF8_PHACS|nr:uncharacterized protein PHACADRAFT_266381 [Phanerochaete carnosa HHB-10118-sp]EKM48408.1 hypothetical protein PHACADRAFT_266381 [Phanerochaete carnosa HHB-10118-sp]